MSNFVKGVSIELLYVIFMLFGVLFSYPYNGDKLNVIFWGILCLTMLMLYNSRLDLLIEVNKLRRTLTKRKENVEM